MNNNYIKVKIEGKNVNNYIKWLIQKKINIANLDVIKHNELNVVISYKDYNLLNKYSKTYKVTILKKYGKLRLFDIIKNNIIILSCLIVSIFFLYILSKVIFSVEIIYNDKEIVNFLEKELAKHNIKKYKFKKDNSYLNKVKDIILRDNKDILEWIEIEESGTKYIIKLVERKKDEKNASALPLIDSANHLGDYYARFKSKYETIEKNGESRRLMAGNIVGTTTAINVQSSVDKEDTNETKEETKVVTKEISGEENIEEEVEDLSEYTIEDLVEYAQLLDEDLKRIEEELMVISEKIKENNKTKESIKETLRSEFSEDLSLAAKQESLKKDLDLLNELKKKLLELSRLKTKIIEEKNKNRTERNRVQEEFNNRILGE